jgi:hypothetical protein
MLTEDLWNTAMQLTGQIKQVPDHVKGIDEYIREETLHRTLAIIDRDPARRASMEEDGYIWRLWNNFGGEASVYKEREDISIQEVLEYRKGMAEDYLPRRCRGEWSIKSTPYAYTTYKSKCFGEEQGRWNCQSEHTHVR